MEACYSEEQKNAIRLFHKDLVVFAGAGSGKTMLLVERFFHAVTKERIAPEKILAITFTEKAAHEMRRRLVARCQEQGLSNLRQELENAPISTIHSFCARVLRENPIESGIDPFFRVLSEGEAEILMEKMIDRLFDEEAENPAWLEILTDYGEENIRQALKNFYDLSRAFADDPKMFQCASHPAQKKHAFQALGAFLKERLRRLDSRGGLSAPEEKFKTTLREMQAWAAGRMPEEGLQVARLLAVRKKLEKRSEKIKGDVERLETLLDAWVLFALEDVLAPVKREFLRVFARFKRAYESEKMKKAAYDFEDLVYLTYKLFSGSPPENQAVLSRVRKLFSCILVDEYQDTSPLQAGIIDLLRKGSRLFIVGDVQQSIYGFRHADPWVLQRLVQGPAGRQAYERVSLSRNHRSRKEILDWINHLFRYSSQKFPFAALEAGKDYASVKPHALEVLCVERGKEKIATLEQARIAEARMLSRHLRELVGSGQPVEEPDGRTRPISYRDFAVLFRSTTSAYLYEKEFLDAGIPFQVLKGKGFYEKPEIADILSCLTFIESPEEDIALACVLRSPLVAVSDDALFWLARAAQANQKETPLGAALSGLDQVKEIEAPDRRVLERFCVWIEKLRAMKDRVKVSDLIRRIFMETGLEAKLLAQEAGKQKLANVLKLVEVARVAEERERVGIGDFIRALKRLSEQEVSETQAPIEGGSGNVVTFSTVHAAKGLEFPCVVVADMGAQPKKNSRGPILSLKETGLGMKWLNPLTRQMSPDLAYTQIEAVMNEKEKEEGERVLYVAMTRAKEHLILSGSAPAEPKSAGGSWMDKVVSVLDSSQCQILKRVITDMPEPWKDPAPKCTVAGELGLHQGLFTPESVRVEAVKDFVDYEERFKAIHRDYFQTQDMTVTDILTASLRAAERGPISPEEDLVPDPDEEEPTTPRNEFGTLFHKLMEILASERPKSIRPKFFNSPFLQALGDEDRAEIKKDVLAFWKGPWGRVVREAKKCYPELPFIYKTGRGVLKGQMDLVLQTRGGEWLLLDYKTNRMTRAQKGPLAKKYEIQISLYAWVFKKLYGEVPSKGVLYFSSIREAAEFSYGLRDFLKLEKDLLSYLHVTQ